MTTTSQRIYCEQDHPGSDQEAENWCRMYHDVKLPRTVAEPAGDFTRMTLCANCDETIERKWTPQQGWDRLLHHPRTYDAPQECPACRPWEGRVLSINGATPGYPTVSAATSAGLFHANCRHALGAYIDGVTRRFTNIADPEGDAARQEQRRLERGVRAWKRREAVALDDVAAKRARAKQREWQARLRTHVDETGGKRLRYREQTRRAI